MSCPTCGFEPRGVSPVDAMAALRSFPRRFEELLQPDEDHDPAHREQDLARLRPIVLSESAAAARDIAEAGADLRRTLVEDEPMLSSSGQPGTAESADDDAFDELRRATATVVDLVERTSGDAWSRTARRGQIPVTALDLLGEAVHAGAHHLRAATKAAGR